MVNQSNWLSAMPGCTTKAGVMVTSQGIAHAALQFRRILRLGGSSSERLTSTSLRILPDSIQIRRRQISYDYISSTCLPYTIL
jgi:hypothetical protein